MLASVVRKSLFLQPTLLGNKNSRLTAGWLVQEVLRFDKVMSQDYRLNRHLFKACEKDVSTLCNNVCSPNPQQACGGQTLRCLTDKKDLVKKQACRQEVFYFIKMEVCPSAACDAAGAQPILVLPSELRSLDTFVCGCCLSVRTPATAETWCVCTGQRLW
jgi:hypothetical protein